MTSTSGGAGQALLFADHGVVLYNMKVSRAGLPACLSHTRSHGGAAEHSSGIQERPCLICTRRVSHSANSLLRHGPAPATSVTWVSIFKGSLGLGFGLGCCQVLE
jgi:hypothetical protein